MTKKIAMVFPGQGSQSQGMLSEFYEAFTQVKDTFDQASDVLKYDLWNIIQNDPEKLSQTEYTQPALLTSSVALVRALQAQAKVEPTYLAGHSLGEYSALVAADALRFEDAVKLVSLRGRYMQGAVPAGEGAVSAILGLDDQTVIDVCQQAEQGQTVSAVNFNAPGQVVIAGDVQAVHRANELAQGKGAKKTQLLPVSVPVHCSLMKPAAENLRSHLNSVDISRPEIPVIHNADVAMHTHPDDIKAILFKQIYSPVRWSESVKLMHQDGIDTFIEVGPGKVLTGLNKRIAKGATLHNTSNFSLFEKLIAEIG